MDTVGKYNGILMISRGYNSNYLTCLLFQKGHIVYYTDVNHERVFLGAMCTKWFNNTIYKYTRRALLSLLRGMYQMKKSRQKIKLFTQFSRHSSRDYSALR